jgi:hypothetical protein
MKPIEIIAQDLFDKVRSRFSNLEMGDENGAVTASPTEARFFDFDFVIEGNNLGRISISIRELGNLKIFYSQGITEDSDSITQSMWYDFLREMRFFAKRRLLRFDTRDITKGNLDKTDFQYLAQNGTKDPNMNESAMYGSTKTSHRPLEDTDLIIRHSEAIDPTKPGARSRKIKNLFIQNKEGERFKFPYVFLPGARAMQRHVANGGTPHDPAGHAIMKCCEEILKLSDFGRKVKYSKLNDNSHEIVERAVGKLKKLRHHCECLSKQGYYEQWKEAFHPQGDEVTELDDATMESYRDAFTVSKFDEALVDIFPLLHSIMQEAGEVDLEDYLVKEDDIANIEDEVKESAFDAFEAWANDITEDEQQAINIDSLQQIMGGDIKLGTGMELISALQGAGINDDELSNSLEQLAKMNPNADSTLVKQVVGSWLEKNQPDLAKQLGGTQEDIASSHEVDPKKNPDMPAYMRKKAGYKLSGDDVKNYTNRHKYDFHKRAHGEKHPEDTREGYYLGQEDFNDWLKDAMHRVAAGKVKDWTELYAELIGDIGFDEERAEKIAQRVFGHDTLAKHRVPPQDDVDMPPQHDDEEDDDSSFLSKLRGQAKSGSIGTEREDSLDGEEEPEDEKLLEPKQKKDTKQEVKDLVLGFFNRTDGTWTRGEHGVVTHVKRHFSGEEGEGGEKEAKMAAVFINFINDQYKSRQGNQAEMEGILKLAGVPMIEAKKPSAGLTKSEKSSIVKKAKAGKDIGKPGKSFDKVAKAAGGGEKGKKIAAAAMWKNAAK